MIQSHFQKSAASQFQDKMAWLTLEKKLNIPMQKVRNRFYQKVRYMMKKDLDTIFEALNNNFSD
jgi:hypothetical protein